MQTESHRGPTPNGGAIDVFVDAVVDPAADGIPHTIQWPVLGFRGRPVAASGINKPACRQTGQTIAMIWGRIPIQALVLSRLLDTAIAILAPPGRCVRPFRLLFLFPPFFHSSLNPSLSVDQSFLPHISCPSPGRQSLLPLFSHLSPPTVSLD
jgi:hypothetical protein